MTVTEVRHPQSRVLLQGVRRMVTREMLEASDQKSLPDGTWGKCPHSRVGTCITQDELDRGTVWARPIEEETDTLLGARLASMQAGIGILHRLW